MKSDPTAELEKLLEQWFLLVDAGEQPDVDAHCAELPHLRDDFRRLLERAGLIDELLELPEDGAGPRTFDVPDRLGDFELLGPLGKGGGGEVFLARQQSLKRLVAVKRVPGGGEELQRQRLRREAEVAASLDHPGVVPIYAIGEEGHDTFIAMKWLSGPALDDLARAPTPEDVARFGAEAARALHAAHVAGIVHRDIKPSNLVLDGDRLMLVDFGLARDSDHVVRTTQEGHVSGTLLYMSPEQIRSGYEDIALDARTDVYSLGATLYELLAGRPPHEGEHPGAVIHGILEERPAPPCEEADLATIVLRALEKDRDQRFDSALALAEEFERWLRGEPILSRPAGVLTRSWKFVRRHRRASLLVSSAATVSLVLAGFLVRDGWVRSVAEAAAIEKVEGAIESGRLYAAEGLLASLSEQSTAPEVLRLQRLLAACQQLEELLDAVQGRRDEITMSVASELLDIEAECLPSELRGRLALARPLALALAGDVDRARKLLADSPSSRGRDALLCAFDSVDGAWQLPEARSSEDRLFAVLALRFANRSTAARREELERARSPKLVPDWRLQLQEAILLINEERHDDAYRVLGWLGREGRYPRIVRRLLLRQSARLGRFDEARQHLSEFRREYGGAWTGADAGMVVYAMRLMPGVSTAEVDAELDRALEVWPKDWLLLRLKAKRCSEDGRIDEAVALLDSALEAASSERRREDSSIDLLLLRANRSVVFLNPGRVEPDAKQRALLEELAASSRDYADRFEHPPALVNALLVASRASLALGDVEAAVALLARLDDEDPRKALELAVQACARGYAERSPSPWVREVGSALARAGGGSARDQLRDVVSGVRKAAEVFEEREDVFLGAPAKAEALLMDAFLSAMTGERDHAVNALDRADEALAGRPVAGIRQRIENLRNRLR